MRHPLQRFITWAREQKAPWRAGIADVLVGCPHLIVPNVPDADDSALCDLAREELAKGNLPLPFPDCTLEFSTDRNTVLVVINTWNPGDHGKGFPDFPGFMMRIIFADEHGILFFPFVIGFPFQHSDPLYYRVLFSENSIQLNQESHLTDASLVRWGVLRVLTLLRMSYARMESVDLSSENKHRARLGRPPFSERRVLVIDSQKVAGIVHRRGGTHASPREHMRRSHLRRLKSGKTVTIPSFKVGDRSRGTVTGPYLVT